MNNPLVTIFLPTYNYAHFLSESLNSILNQTYSNFELFLIDNASTDNTQEVVKTFEPHFKNRLINIKHSKNLGAEKSIKPYFKEFKGDIVTFQAGDDVWLPKKLEDQVDIFCKDPNIDFIYTNYIIWDTRNQSYPTEIIAYRGEMPEKDILPRLLLGNFIAANTVAVTRKSLLKTNGYEDWCTLINDYVLWLKIATNSQAHYIDTPLVKIRKHGGNLSSNKFRKLSQQEFIFLSKFLINLPQNRLPFTRKFQAFFFALKRLLGAHLKTSLYPASPGI